MTTDNRLNATDEVMATLEAQGGVLASVQKHNFTSVDDVVRFVMALAGKFVGLGKLFIAYQEQQSAKNYWQQQQWIRQPQQPEQPQNGQPVDTQQSDDVPPPFNS